jgi:hypothetical protein
MEPLPGDFRVWKRRNGKPLRRSEEVIHLEAHDQPEDDECMIDYIHEAQISIMIAGIDDWFWTAYCFVDVYFKDEENSELVHRLSTSSRPMDPHTCSKYDLDRPIWNPRHYFLRILACRMEQVKQEWSNAVFQLFEEIEPCVICPSLCRYFTDLA